MTEKPKKVVIIGLDCALPNLIEKHIAEGKLPTFKKLFDNGVFAENGLVPFPTVTPPNWATIATGAWPGTHGIGYFQVHKPGTTPLDMNTESAFNSKRLKAETLWEALDRVGKKCIVMNYPGSWPSTMKNGIVVGGRGLSIGENRDGMSGLNSTDNLCSDMLVTTDIYPMAIRGSFQDAEGWKNINDIDGDPLEMSVDLNFPEAEFLPKPTRWHVLVKETADDGYDQVSLSPTKDINDAFCSLKAGEWSSKVFTSITMSDESTVDVFFRCKLLELSDDAEDFRLLITGLNAVEGWSSPPEIARQIVSAEGLFTPAGGLKGYFVGWFDLDTYVEINNFHSIYLADAASYLMQDQDWDLFAMHSHPPDWMYHAILTDMDEITCQDEKKRKTAWDAHLKIYESQDRMIARILEAAGKDALVVLVSDHGATADGPPFNPYDVLVPAGLCTEPRLVKKGQDKYEGESARTSSVLDKLKADYFAPDLSKSKALPQRPLYIYVNLKGRDPEGIVEPADYKKVQREIIDALYSHVDPGTGKRPVALALTKKDARMIGLYGDDVGDVVYAIYPEFGSQHGAILPTAELGIGTLKALYSFTGPGVKKGLRLKRNAWITDMVPTICYLMNWPLPEQAEGAVLYQIFENPNFRSAEG